MSELDDRLRESLRRTEPPAGFAERVMQRAAAEGAAADERRPARVLWMDVRRPIVRWAAAAAIVAAVGGGMHYRNVEKARAEQAAGEAAKAQVLEALRITASKLQLVQAKVREVGS